MDFEMHILGSARLVIEGYKWSRVMPQNYRVYVFKSIYIKYSLAILFFSSYG
jgi:hypothetical protein